MNLRQAIYRVGLNTAVTTSIFSGIAIEIRKYINVAESQEGDHVYYVNGEGEHHICASGKYGFPFFGRMIRDCIDRTETAMKQDYIFRISELAIEAREKGIGLGVK